MSGIEGRGKIVGEIEWEGVEFEIRLKGIDSFSIGVVRLVEEIEVNEGLEVGECEEC